MEDTKVVYTFKDKWEFVEYYRDALSIKAKEYYEKYGEYMYSDVEDIEQTLLLVAAERFDELSNNPGTTPKKNNVKSTLYRLNRYFESALVNSTCVMKMPINIYKTIANGRVYDLSNVSYTEEQDPTYEEAKVELMKKRMHDVVNTLSGRQKQVIILRFGFIGGRMYTQDETGLLVGRHRPVEGKENVVSGESVRSIEARALRSLRRKVCNGGELRDLKGFI